MRLFNFSKPDINKLKADNDINGLIKVFKKARDGSVLYHATEALGEIGGTKAVEPLIEALQKKRRSSRWRDFPSRDSIAKALGDIGDARAVDPLIEALKDENGLVKSEAAKALGKIGDKRAVAPLIEALKGWGRVTGEAAKALAEIGDKRAVEPLIQTIERKYRDNDSAPSVAKALGDIGDARAVEPLIYAINKTGWKPTEEAIKRALVNIKDEKAIEPFFQAMSHYNSEVRKVAAHALENLGWIPKNNNEKVLLLIAKQQWDELLILGEPAVDLLIQTLKDRDSDVKESAALTLGRVGNVKAIEALIENLREYNDIDSHINKTITTALSSIGLPAVVPLLQAFKREDVKRKWNEHHIEEAIVNIRDAGVDDILIEALKDRNDDVRLGVAKIYFHYSNKISAEKVIEPLVCTLKDSNEYVRHYAAEALKNMGWSPKNYLN